ncbi:MAG: glycosyltransferase family 4 protein [Gemmatimonadaceae bacterium]
MEPLRIVMVAACPFPYPRGTPIRVLRLSEALAARGHDVHVVTYHLGEPTPAPSLTLHRTVNLRTYRKTSAGPSLQKLVVLDPLLAVCLRRVLRDHPADVVHAHHYEGLLVAAALRRRIAAALVFDVHTLLEHELSSYLPFGPRRWVDTAAAWIDRRAPALADHVVAVTPAIQDSLVRHGAAPAERVSVVMNGVSLAHFGERPHAGGVAHAGVRTLIYAGGLASYQRIDLLLGALRALLQRRQDVRLNIVSHEPLEGVHHLARRYGVDAYTTLSRVRFGEVPALLARSEVALNPRTSCIGVPMKLLNYMAASKPVVSFSGAAYPLEHGSTGWVVENENVEAFAQAICLMLDDRALARQLGENARRAVATRFTWEAAAAETEAIYGRLLTRR